MLEPQGSSSRQWSRRWLQQLSLATAAHWRGELSVAPLPANNGCLPPPTAPWNDVHQSSQVMSLATAVLKQRTVAPQRADGHAVIQVRRNAASIPHALLHPCPPHQVHKPVSLAPVTTRSRPRLPTDRRLLPIGRTLVLLCRHPANATLYKAHPKQRWSQRRQTAARIAALFSATSRYPKVAHAATLTTPINISDADVCYPSIAQ